jgi:hypothetical protein
MVYDRTMSIDPSIPATRKRALTALIVAFACAMLIAHALHFRAVFQGNCPDDAYISFRYAENLARGSGLVFNPGERVEGYSNFLWVVILATMVPFVDDLTTVAQICGVLAACAALVLVAVAARSRFSVTDPTTLAFALALLGGSGYLAGWSVSGLESGAFALALIAAWYRYAVEVESDRDRFPASALLFALVAMLRPEGVLIALAMIFIHIILFVATRVDARRRWLFPALLLLLVIGYEAFRFLYYGAEWVPNSVHAKVGFSWTQIQRGSSYVTRRFLYPYALLLLTAGLVPRLWRRPAFVVGQMLFMGYLLFVIVVGGDWSRGRFFAPLLPLAAVLLVAALEEVARSPWARLLPHRRVVAGLLGAAYLTACFVATTPRGEGRNWRLWTRGDAERVAIGRWLRDVAPQDAVVGVLAAGLNDPHIANMDVSRMGRGAPGHEKYDPEYTLHQVRPDIIVGGDRLFHFKRHPTFHREYSRITHFWSLHEVYVRRDFLPRLQR